MTIAIGLPSSSAIPDYATLVSTVSDWLDRDDLNAKIPVFIQMAEAMFNRELRTPDMEKETILSADSETVALPADYLGMRAIYIEGSPDQPLRSTSPSSQRQEYNGTAGTPTAYTLVNGGLTLIPPPDATTSLHLDYIARIDALNDASMSNWLLEKHPDAYLYATLFYAEQQLDNATRVGQWKILLDQVMASINNAAKADRYGAGPIARSPAKQVGAARC